MNNLEKLLKYLVKENDYKELALKSGVDEKVIRKFTMDIFARIIPTDFNKQEGSHIDEKDLVAIVSNFNAVVKEENLKTLISNGVKKYGLDVKQASSILMAVIPTIHTNIQKMTNPQKVQETKAEQKSEADKIFENISNRANEDIKPVEKKEVIKPQIKEEVIEEEVEEEVEEIVDDGKLSTLEKVCIYVVLACLVALIITFVVILIL